MVDFINGFIEVYGDPLGLKGSWEGIVEYKNMEATKRTKTISDNAQWFEDHSPVAPEFRKPKVKGVTANVICAAMLGGDEYPASAIGINLPNADWIRAEHGSKSITICNLTEAYSKAAHGNGFMTEFVIDKATNDLIEKYGDVCDDLHTDLHECLGHGSGRLRAGTDPDALKAYGNTIEEARADLFGLYYIADDKLIELGLVPNKEAYKSQYYTYMQNGLLTQSVRISLGSDIEEAHMRNRALIANWALDLDKDNTVVNIVERDGKHYVEIKDYEALRNIFAQELHEIQRIKSEGDLDMAKSLVEKYGIKLNPNLHSEVLRRYELLNIAPYKGFINPWMKPQYDADGNIKDIVLDYTETYSHQMLRYSGEY
jgi:dipeptidyl-peptidase-3